MNKPLAILFMVFSLNNLALANKIPVLTKQEREQQLQKQKRDYIIKLAIIAASVTLTLIYFGKDSKTIIEFDKLILNLPYKS